VSQRLESALVEHFEGSVVLHFAQGKAEEVDQAHSGLMAKSDVEFGLGRDGVSEELYLLHTCQKCLAG